MWQLWNYRPVLPLMYWDMALATLDAVVVLPNVALEVIVSLFSQTLFIKTLKSVRMGEKHFCTLSDQKAL